MSRNDRNRGGRRKPLFSDADAAELDAIGTGKAPAEPKRTGNTLDLDGPWSDWEEELDDLVSDSDSDSTPGELEPEADPVTDSFIVPRESTEAFNTFSARAIKKPDEVARLEKLELPEMYLVGEALRMRLRVSNLKPADAERIEISIGSVDVEGGVNTIHRGSLMHAARGMSELMRDGQGIVVYDPRSFGPALIKQLRGGVDGKMVLRIALSLGDHDVVSTTEVRDRLDIALRTHDGATPRPRVYRLRTPAGAEYIGTFRGVEQGIRIEGVPVGEYMLTFEDRVYFDVGNGRGVLHAPIATAGLAAARRGAAAEPTAVTITVREPVVCFVHPDARDGGDGTMEAPYNSVAGALAAEAGKPRPTGVALELRISSVGSSPGTEPGIVTETEGGQWGKWWRGEAASPTGNWTLPERGAESVRGVPEDVNLTGLKDIRLVSAMYAARREAMAKGGERVDRMGLEYAGLPLIPLSGPDDGAQAQRLLIEDCARVFIEGFELSGRVAQAGVRVRSSQQVEIRRCRVLGFRSGKSRAGRFAVGRGVTIEKCTAPEGDVAVNLEHCEMGWNDARRQGFEVAGAGIAVFGSAVSLVRCVIHDNVASGSPAGAAVDPQSRVSGISNHRTNNETRPG